MASNLAYSDARHKFDEMPAWPPCTRVRPTIAAPLLLLHFTFGTARRALHSLIHLPPHPLHSLVALSCLSATRRHNHRAPRTRNGHPPRATCCCCMLSVCGALEQAMATPRLLCVGHKHTTPSPKPVAETSPEPDLPSSLSVCKARRQGPWVRI